MNESKAPDHVPTEWTGSEKTLECWACRCEYPADDAHVFTTCPCDDCRENEKESSIPVCYGCFWTVTTLRTENRATLGRINYLADLNIASVQLPGEEAEGPC